MGILASILASIVVSGTVGFFSARYALEGRAREGQSVFTNIGLRYFDALLAAHDAEPGESTLRPSQTRERWDAYREVLGSIEEDIRWLRTNPFYDRIISTAEDPAFLQNVLVREVTETDCSANLDTLCMMCEVFVESGEFANAVSASGEHTSAISAFARSNCSSRIPLHATCRFLPQGAPPLNNCSTVVD